MPVYHTDASNKAGTLQDKSKHRLTANILSLVREDRDYPKELHNLVNKKKWNRWAYMELDSENAGLCDAEHKVG